MKDRDIELIKQNISRDRRRRYLYLNKDNTSGLQIFENELKKMAIVKNTYLWAMMAFILPFGIFRQAIIPSALLAIAIFVIGQAYLKFIFLKNRTEVKLTETEFNNLNNPEMLKARRNHQFSLILIPLLMLLIIFSMMYDEKTPLVGFDQTFAKFAMAVMFATSGMGFPKFLELHKLYKKYKLPKSTEEDNEKNKNKKNKK